MRVYHELDPFFEEDSRILILGSMPSVKSREQGFYYAHPQNRFWKVLSRVFEEAEPSLMEEKKAFLKKHYIALWDTIASCTIKGSSDSSIRDVEVNDIKGLIEKTKIKKVYTTGRKSYDLYQKYCYPTTGIEAIYLPSTSPLNSGNFTVDDLTNIYQMIKGALK